MGRGTAFFRTFRPRAIARSMKSVDDLLVLTRELKRAVKRLDEARTRSDDRVSAFEAELRSLKTAIGELGVREGRLRAVYERDAAQREALPGLSLLLRADVVGSHVERAVETASLHFDPFPHLVVEQLFPPEFFEAVVRGIPPVELFDGADNKQRVVVPFEMAPAFSHRVWSFLLNDVIDATLGPALLKKLRAPLGDWLAAIWPDLAGQPVESLVSMQSTDGRILLRRRGYKIPPHRDPKWGFITCLLYLARPGDSEAWGTQLYAVDGDTEAASILPHWIREDQCRLVKDVPFRPNTALVFLNSQGAHGAHIPASAEPDTLERYIYQFRIGPTADSIRRLVRLLPEEQRERWSGKVADYV